MTRIIVAIVFSFVSNFLFSELYLIGPTLQYNIGGGERKWSGGVEFSYWHWIEREFNFEENMFGSLI